MANITTDELLAGIRTAVEERADLYIRLADDIWEFAELGFAESRSSRAQMDVLAAEGFKITTGIGGSLPHFLQNGVRESP
ncbi:hypothetical protein LZK80_37745 (plasmid) [Rhizobium leguminosarum]|nr:hypothetical protein LZK80_37745 [Rhizobium leguminosarum]UIL31551.1 hypothetical protein LZK75_38010 [Rhizobium leguminosarum]